MSATKKGSLALVALAGMAWIACRREAGPTPEPVADTARASVTASAPPSSPTSSATASPAPPAPRGKLYCGLKTPPCVAGLEACEPRKPRCVPIAKKVPGVIYQECSDATHCGAGEACCETTGGQACVGRGEVASRCFVERCHKSETCPSGQACTSLACASVAKRTTCGATVCEDVPDETIIVGAPAGKRDCVWVDKAAACAPRYDELWESAMKALAAASFTGAVAHAGIYECTTKSDCGDGFVCCALLDATQASCRLRCDTKTETPVCATAADCDGTPDGGPACVAAANGMPGLRSCAR